MNRLCSNRSKQFGFTLIELMTSMAIISLLAVIAIPTIQSALTRAQVVKTYTDMDVLRDGVELFAADVGRFPRGSTQPPTSFMTDYDARVVLQPLVGSYIPDQEGLLEDYFSQKAVSEFKKSIRLDLSSIPDSIGYSYFNYQHFLVPPSNPSQGFSIISLGPDGKDSGLGVAVVKPSIVPSALYSPTNGVFSHGDLGVVSSNLGVMLSR